MRKTATPLINPNTTRFEQAYPTRMLTDHLGLLGVEFLEPRSNLIWTIMGVYAPVTRRRVSGIRARVMNRSGHASFINQRDLELCLDLAEPGDLCAWLGGGEIYPDPFGSNWYGCCMDEEDRIDELHLFEVGYRHDRIRETGHPALEIGKVWGLYVHLEFGEDRRITYEAVSDPIYPDGQVEWTEVGILDRWRATRWPGKATSR